MNRYMTLATRRAAMVAAAVLITPVLLSAQQSSQQSSPTDTSVVTSAATASAQGQTITYEQALRIALQRNVTLRQTENTAASDAVSVKQARMALLPDLRLTTQGAQTYGRNFNQTDGALVNTSQQTVNAGLASSVTLFDGLRNVSNIRQAQYTQTASENDVTRAKQTTVFTVASNFVAVVQQQELLRVSEQALDAQLQLEQQVQAYVDAGSRPISDLYTQQAAVASARLAVTQARRSLGLARIDVMATLQLDPALDYQFVTPQLPTDSTTTAPPSLDSLINTAMQTRTDIAAQESRLKAADASIASAAATKWPMLSLSFGYNTSFSSASNFAFVDQLDQRRGGSVALGFSFPLFDRASTSTAAQKARIQSDNARIALDSQRRDVGMQVRRAWLDLTSAREQLISAQAQVRAAEQALTASQERYNAGAATLVELAQARATQVQAASALINARYNLVLQGTVMNYYTGSLTAPTS